jgi:transcriptional regulator with AAA-type ATPase domain/transcriptional regulatory protein LevR
VLKIEKIYDQLIKLIHSNPEGVSASELAQALKLSRSVASRYLNELAKKKQVYKQPGKPVKYFPVIAGQTEILNSIETKSAMPPDFISLLSKGKINLIGSELSLKPLVEKAFAALFYPAKGLHILLSGETGVGKSYFAEFLAKSASFYNQKEIPFITFNCANYAQNPELLMGQIFGIKKGAYTGANMDEVGLVQQANGGILFLDEIHRLPPSGQEMLFYLIDKGLYRRLGEADTNRYAQVTVIGATTESLESALLPTLLRRFSIKLTIPPLRERSKDERKQFLQFFLEQEAKKMNIVLKIDHECQDAFLTYACRGNIGQLKSDIQISCARAFLRYIKKSDNTVTIRKEDLPSQVVSSLAVHNETIVPQNDIQENAIVPNIYEDLMQEIKKIQPEASTQFNQTNSSEKRVAVLIVTHGNSTAASMAEVANYLLGSNIIESIDMPLDEPTATTYKRVQRKISQMKNRIGVLMLVDIGSLVTMGDALQQEFSIPIKTIANVHLLMLIEAGRKALVPENSLEMVYEATKNAYYLLAPKKAAASGESNKQRLILTACFTGEGTAQLLLEWIKKNLPPEDKDIVIRAIRIDPENQETSIISQLEDQYFLIAIIGTVPIRVNHVPYIPAWELLNDDGGVRLKKLIEKTRPEKNLNLDDYRNDVTENEIRDLVEIGLGKIVHCLNPKLFCDILEEHFPSLSIWYNWDTSRQLGLWIHIGNLVDQCIQSSLLKKEILPKNPLPPAAESLKEEDFKMWQPLLDDLERHFHIPLTPKIRQALISIAL